LSLSEDTLLKKCTKCEIEKPLNQFHKVQIARSLRITVSLAYQSEIRKGMQDVEKKLLLGQSKCTLGKS
jgi:uncharacterized protein YhaN